MNLTDFKSDVLLFFPSLLVLFNTLTYQEFLCGAFEQTHDKRKAQSKASKKNMTRNVIQINYWHYHVSKATRDAITRLTEGVCVYKQVLMITKLTTKAPRR